MPIKMRDLVSKVTGHGGKAEINKDDIKAFKDALLKHLKGFGPMDIKTNHIGTGIQIYPDYLRLTKIESGLHYYYQLERYGSDSMMFLEDKIKSSKFKGESNHKEIDKIVKIISKKIRDYYYGEK